MKIVDIRIRDEDKKSLYLKEAEFIQGKGIKGDINAKGSDRQISILSLQTKTNVEKLKYKGLCIPKFFNNLTIDNIDIKKIHIGKIIEIGNAKIEITEVGKECFPNCKLVQEGTKCDLTTDTIFAKVIKTGSIALGDELL